MVSEELLRNIIQESRYSLKAGTKGSYYWKAGCKILPERLTIQKNELAKTRKKGRYLLHTISGQMLSTFKKDEESPLKKVKPYVCRTLIWKIDEYPLFVGYGTTGITTEEGLQDTGDLVLFYTADNWNTFRIFFFAGMGTEPDYLLPCFEYASKLINI